MTATQGLIQALLVLTCCFSICSAIPGASVIYSYFPTKGSLAGGTILTILGGGFQRDNVSGVYDYEDIQADVPGPLS